MLKLSASNTHVRIVEAAAHEVEWLKGSLTFEYEKWSPKERRKKIFSMSFLKGNPLKFPIGLLKEVQLSAIEDDVDLEMLDMPRAPCLPTLGVDISWLDAAQRAAVDAICKKVRGIMWLPTRFGKSEIAFAMMKMHKCNWLFFVHRTTLMHETADRFFKTTGERAGIIGDGNFAPARVTVTTYQTLYKMLNSGRKSKKSKAMELLRTTQGAFMDEGHTLPSATFYSVAMLCNAYWRIVLTGTPFGRSDQRGQYVIAASGPVIMHVKTKAGVESGRLARTTVRMVPFSQPPLRGNWQAINSECVVESFGRNDVLTRIVRKAKKPCLVFVNKLKHGQNLLKMVTRKGTNAEFVSGKSNTDQRQAAVKKLIRGDIDVLYTTTIFQEGVTIPSLASVVFASGGESPIALLQSIGRGMGTTDTKTTCEVWDVYDKSDKASRKYDVHVWALERHAKARLRMYKEEGHTVEMLRSGGIFVKV